MVVVGYISPIISGLRITNGDATGLGGVGGHDAGGGVYAMDSAPTMRDNRVFDNSAEDGGGLCLYDSAATLRGNTITSNTASQDGGGLSLYDGGATLNANTVTSNTANTGGGLSVGITVAAGNTATLVGTLWYSNTEDWGGAGAVVTGTHNYWGDPRFEADGFHLMEGSAAIDVGVEAGVPNDVDGERRPRGLAPDLGADEGAGTNIYLPAVLRNSP